MINIVFFAGLIPNPDITKQRMPDHDYNNLVLPMGIGNLATDRQFGLHGINRGQLR